MISREEKQELIKEFGRSEGDTGSPEVQIAILTHRIRQLTEHLRSNPKDHSSRRGMYMLIGQRKGLLNYLEKKDIERYRDLLEKLNIRR